MIYPANTYRTWKQWFIIVRERKCDEMEDDEKHRHVHHHIHYHHLAGRHNNMQPNDEAYHIHDV